MTFWRAIIGFLFGERGPDDIVVSRDAHGVCFRMPNQWHPRESTSSWMLFAATAGPILLTLVIGCTLALPEDERDLPPMIFTVVCTLAIMLGITYRWRIVWHYELHLAGTTVSVDLYTSFYHRRMWQVDLQTIEQLTVVRGEKKSLLQGESPTDPPKLILPEQEHGHLVRLANLLAEALAALDPARPRRKVAEESSLKGVLPHRLEPPLGTAIVATRQETGITFDFPLGEDRRVHMRRRAWRMFEIAIFMLMTAIIGFAVCVMNQWLEGASMACLLFVPGIVLLIIAAGQSANSWTDTICQDELRQLAVAGNLLIRTTRDHHKQLWYRQEIAAILLEDEVQVQESHSEGGGSTVIAVHYHLRLVVSLLNGEKTILTHWGDNYPLTDYRPRAGLEWVATQLRQALFGEQPQPPQPDIAKDKEPLAHAIQTPRVPIDETRIR